MQFRWYCSLAVVLVAAYVLLPARLPVWRNLALVLLVLTVFADLFVADRDAMAEQDLTWWGWTVKTRDTDFASYYSPSAARFLQSREGEEPFRYLGYDSGLTEGSHLSSPAWFADSETHMLEANGRPMLTGLQSVHGYNPTHISHYDQFMSTLNKGEQNYHFMDVYEKGLASPLLDLLNARYIIVPTDPSQENPDGVGRFERFGSTHPTVYEDNDSKVLENQQTLPRAWIVHSARKEALTLLESGEVNPRNEALLEEEPPQQMSTSSNVDDASVDQALVEEYEANNIKLKTSTGSGELLVLSEVYYPSWKAYIDGQPAEVYATNQLLRSVPIPAGEHEVELRYESAALEVGIIISVVAYAVCVVFVFGVGLQYRYKRVGNAEST